MWILSLDEREILHTDGANLNALSAACALGVIKLGEVVDHSDRAVRAGTSTLGASDTAVGTHLAGECALIVVGASDSDDNAVLLHLDGSVRTVLSAKSASGAEARDDLCNTVGDDDRVVGTSRRTVAETDAGIGTNVFALPMLCRLAAGLEAGTEILFILLGSLAGTVTANVSELLDGHACLNSEDGCDLL